MISVFCQCVEVIHIVKDRAYQDSIGHVYVHGRLQGPLVDFDSASQTFLISASRFSKCAWRVFHLATTAFLT
jgi:hypothetical protein